MDIRLRSWFLIVGIVVMTVMLTAGTLVVLGDESRTLDAAVAVRNEPPSLESEVEQGIVPIDWPKAWQRVQIESLVEENSSVERSSVSGSDYANCRFGVGVVRNPIDVYTDASKLRIGWYYDWRTAVAPPTPNGVEYYQTIRLSQPKDEQGNYIPTYTVNPPLTDEGLGARIDANLGAVWMVGNEPDRVEVQDDMLPDQYAIAYHDVYHFIKGRDPTARVAIGGVIQPTPLRLQYLDMILDHYYQTYGVVMPVDIWNIHVYIIREVEDDWGARIPPGIDASVGVVYPITAHGNITVFSGLVEDFRQWMADRGQRDKPLIISEMGVLMPEWWQPIFDEAKVIQFMYDSFDYLLSAVSSEIGYPADNNRLVQRWNWYSLDDDSVDKEGYLHWNGTLFNSTTRLRTAFGEAFANYAAAITPAVDLAPYQLAQQPAAPFSPIEPVTITLQASIVNAGNVPFTASVTVRFYEVSGTSEIQIGSDQTISNLVGCAAQQISVGVVWPEVTPGTHSVRVKVDPTNTIFEGNEDNNTLNGTVLVSTDRIFLPLVLRSF